MFPAVKDGDLIVAFKLQVDYQKSDVVIYKEQGKTRIGRFIAQEKDVVIMDDTGTLLINGVVQGGEIVYPTYAKEGVAFPYQVPENEIFLLGDHRTQSTDSRDFGTISMDEVEGKVITILRRRGL